MTTNTPRSARAASRDSCGFCEGTHGQFRGICRDSGGHCKGTWPGFVPASLGNPDGSWTCSCSAAGHPGRVLQGLLCGPGRAN